MRPRKPVHDIDALTYQRDMWKAAALAADKELHRIENDAHAALDAAGIPAGPLPERIAALVAREQHNAIVAAQAAARAQVIEQSLGEAAALRVELRRARAGEDKPWLNEA